MEYLSTRVRAIGLSPTLRIADLAGHMKKEGLDVISLSAGEPDFGTPKDIKDAAIKAIQDGFTYYTAAAGIDELKDAILYRIKEDQDLTYHRDEVMTTNGGKQALYQTFQALIDPGDEVLIPKPYWVSFPEQAKLAGGIPIFIETKEENSFKMTVEDLEGALSSKSKVLVLNNPHNPTGHLYSKEELQSFIPLLKDRGLFVISDEIYEHMVYEGTAVSIASLDHQLRERTIIINGLSKSHAMTGWRVGYALAPKGIISAMLRLQSHLTSNINSIAQKAAVAALTGPWDEVEKMVEEFRVRRDLMVSGINSIPYLRCAEPKGAFYLWVYVGDLLARSQGRIIDDFQLGEDLLKKALLATIPGTAFGVPHYLRLSYATSQEDLKGALGRLREYVEDF